MADTEIDAQQSESMLELDSGRLEADPPQVTVVVPADTAASDILQQALQEASDEVEGANLSYATVEERVAAIHGEVLDVQSDDQATERPPDAAASQGPQGQSSTATVPQTSSEVSPKTSEVSNGISVPDDVAISAEISSEPQGNQTISRSVHPEITSPAASTESCSDATGSSSNAIFTTAKVTITQGTTPKENVRFVIKPAPRVNLAHRSNTTSILKQNISAANKPNGSSLLHVPLPKTPPRTLPSTSSQAVAASRVSASPKSSKAPLGSSENPIQIIQQGNTYHSTQVLTRDQLQQIAHVLQQQQVTRAVQNGGSAVLYNPATNTRIIYRVIYPSELSASGKGQAVQKPSIGRGSGGKRGRGRSRKGGLLRKVDDEDSKQDAPELSREEKEEKKKHRPRTRSGRISRPPSYMVKDYKRIHHLDFDEEPYDDSDGGYSDFQLSDEEGAEHGHKGALLSKPRKYKCSTCEKAYIGKAGLGRHYRLNPSHGTLPETDDLSTHDENSNSSLTSTRSSTSFQKRISEPPSFVGTVPTFVREDAGSVRRKSKLKEILHLCRDEELIEVVLPRLSQVITLWEFLLTKCERGDPAEPNVSELLKNVENLIKQLQKFTKECLNRTSDAEEGSDKCVKIANEVMAQVLGVSPGTYAVKQSKSNAGSQNTKSGKDDSIHVSSSIRQIVRIASSQGDDGPLTKRPRLNNSEETSPTVTISNSGQSTGVSTGARNLSLHGIRVNRVDYQVPQAAQDASNVDVATDPVRISGVIASQTQGAPAQVTSVVSAACPTTSNPAALLVSSNPICSTLPIQDVRMQKVHVLGSEGSSASSAMDTGAPESNIVSRVVQASEVLKNLSADNLESNEYISVNSVAELALICSSTDNIATCSPVNATHSSVLTDKAETGTVIMGNEFVVCSSSLNDAMVVSVADVLNQRIQARVAETETSSVLSTIVSNSIGSVSGTVNQEMAVEQSSMMIQQQMVDGNGVTVIQQEAPESKSVVLQQEGPASEGESVVFHHNISGDSVLIRQESAPEGTSAVVETAEMTSGNEPVTVQQEMEAVVGEAIMVQEQPQPRSSCILIQQETPGGDAIMIQQEAATAEGNSLLVQRGATPTHEAVGTSADSIVTGVGGNFQKSETMAESVADSNVEIMQADAQETNSTEVVVCNEEALLTTSADETAVIRHLMLPDGQIIGTVASTSGQLEGLAALGEQVAQGFLPGNVIIVQNPDGTTTLQVPSDQPIPLETVQALLAMDHGLTGAEIADGVEVAVQHEALNEQVLQDVQTAHERQECTNSS